MCAFQSVTFSAASAFHLEKAQFRTILFRAQNENTEFLLYNFKYMVLDACIACKVSNTF